VVDNMPDLGTQKNKKRNFLRIPLKAKAQLFFDGKHYADVDVHDISVGGISFYIPDSPNLPNVFEVCLCLPRSSRSMKIIVEALSRHKTVSGMARMGCRFSNILTEDRESIANYIIKTTHIASVFHLVAVASLLVFLDAIWRICSYVFVSYYEVTELGEIIFLKPLPRFYAVILLVYAASSFISFLFTAKQRAEPFLGSIACLGIAFCFGVVRNIQYWRLELWQAPHYLVKAFYLEQLALSALTALALIVGMRAVGRISSVVTCRQLHEAGFAFRKEKGTSSL